MFTGIVEETGRIAEKQKVREGFRFQISSRKVLKKLNVSDSVAVNGVCLTVTSQRKKGFEVIAVQETLKKSTLGNLKKGDEVNLESSLRVGSEIGGHFVFGHVDDTGIISSIKHSKNYEFFIKIKSKHKKFIIPTGSVAVNGVSLTVAKITMHPKRSKYFQIKIAIIPYTYKNTTFKDLKVNDKVNIEFDFLGKYVLNILEKRKFNK
jgi:riboflavin synthase